jgi:hypothetical protein
MTSRNVPLQQPHQERQERLHELAQALQSCKQATVLAATTLHCSFEVHSMKDIKAARPPAAQVWQSC